MRRIPVFVACLSLLCVGCSPSTTDTTTVHQSSTVSSSSPSTTTSSRFGGISVDYEGLADLQHTTITASTTTTSAATTTVPALSEHAPMLLVAHEDGIDLWNPDQVTPILRGREVGVAFPDFVGGVIFSTWNQANRNVIEWIPRLGDEPEVLIADSEAKGLQVAQVSYVAGQRTLVYRKWIELPNDCDNDTAPECAWVYQRENLILRNLDTDEDINMGMIGSFESSGVTIRLGGDFLSFSYFPYGSENVCSAVIPFDNLVAGASAERWIGEGSALLEAAGLVDELCDGAVRAFVAGDGLSYLEVSGGVSIEPAITVKALHTGTGDEFMHAEISEPKGLPSFVDFDGTHGVIGLLEGANTFLIDLDGTVTELDIEGRATIWSDS